MGRGRSILIVVAVALIGVGGYGTYHASALGSTQIADGTIVEVRPHTGSRPTCVRNGHWSRRCLTPNATEPYTYFTEVVEFEGPGGQLTTGVDPRQRGGAHDDVGDQVKVIQRPGHEVEIAPRSSRVVSVALLLAGLALLGFVLISARLGRRPRPGPPRVVQETAWPPLPPRQLRFVPRHATPATRPRP